MKKITIIFFFLTTLTFASFSHPNKLSGQIVDARTQEIIPYATIYIKKLNIGTVSDLSGNFSISDLPEGETRLSIQMTGYGKLEKTVWIQHGENELHFSLQPSLQNLEEVVVSANRNTAKRKEAAVIVGVLNQKTLETTSSCNLAEGLNFQSGLRVENNCQNCGFQQVRINGLEGPYSQILIDSKAIFSSLAGVYGIEHIPTNMIDRVEVVRGGGSALFGSNAIAGTINVITKEPTNNSFSLSETFSLVGGNRPDNVININGSLVSDDNKAGIYLFSMFRDRSAWDKDGDGFSELGKLRSNIGGFRSYYKPSYLSKLSIEYHRIQENRRGGDQLNLPPHETQITEMANHHINGGGINYQVYSEDGQHNFSVYTSLQDVKRDTYYGTNYNPDAYGSTQNITLASGTQYSFSMDQCLFMPSQLTAGIEFHYDNLHDEMLGYQRDLKQITRIYGGYLQNEWKNRQFTLLVGGRLDKHNLIDKAIFSPRLNLRYTPQADWVFRASYAAGYRAPQTFDEDLHVTAVGGEVSFIHNAEGLKPEYSHSLSASADYTFSIHSAEVNVVVDAFYTQLNDVFVLEEVGVDTQGNLLKERRNGSGASIKGVNIEMQARPAPWMEVQAGFTLQKSEYKTPEQWSEDIEVAPIKQMLRTPDYYGFITSSLQAGKRVQVSFTGNYTGKMYVPHFAGYIEKNALQHTPNFFDFGFRCNYTLPLSKSNRLQIFAGAKNLFNSFQKDFDKGMDRDAGYVYGPSLPRTIFAGLKVML